jgi:hypothetical protein
VPASIEKELADKEKWLVEIELQGLAAMHRMVEELQAIWAVEAQKGWIFLGQTKTVLGNKYGR